MRTHTIFFIDRKPQPGVQLVINHQPGLRGREVLVRIAHGDDLCMRTEVSYHEFRGLLNGKPERAVSFLGYKFPAEEVMTSLEESGILAAAERQRS